MRAYLRVILSVAVAAPLFALVACDETIDATKTVDAGTDATVDAGPTTSLFQRLGGKAGITKFVDATLVEELKDPEIAAFFAANLANTAGRPTGAQIKGCLVAQISAAASDPTKGDPAAAYPAKLDDGYQCRDMKTAHATLGIGAGAFDKFGAIAAGVAKASGVADADLKSVSDFLAIQKPLIVTGTTTTDGGTDSGTDSAVVDSGTDTGSIVDASDAG